MSEPPSPPNAVDLGGGEPTGRLVQALLDQWAAERVARGDFERQTLAVMERIALALERLPAGAQVAAVPPGDEAASFAAEVRGAIDERRWERARAILDARAGDGTPDPRIEALTIELDRARERAVADLHERLDAARQANDAAGALAARDELAEVLGIDDLKAVDRPLVAWLMKLIQRRLRSIPVGSDLAALATEVATRFAATPEGASLRAALPTLRRSAGLCPRCSEPYLGVDDACPKCLAEAGQAPSPTPTLTFVTDDLDAIVDDSAPIDLNNAETWQLP